MSGTIYTDGHSVSVSDSEALALFRLGLVEPHPGAGYDGITADDFRLTPHATWEQVSDALGDTHHAEQGS